MSEWNQETLLLAARALAGWTVDGLAMHVGYTERDAKKDAKGKVGRVIERALGASRNTPLDFPSIGVEMKTLPVSAGCVFSVKESTFVTHLNAEELMQHPWENSSIRFKLQRVLFVPVLGVTALHKELTIGHAFYFSASWHESLLQNDYEHIREQFAMHGLNGLSGHLGHALQVRPKGRNAQDKTWTNSEEGAQLSMKRGYYLRASFTQRLLQEAP